MPHPTELVLIRHGEARAPGPGEPVGLADPALTPRGRWQAEALASGWAGAPPDVIHASAATRARQTAAPLAARCGLAVRPHEDLVELRLGHPPPGTTSTSEAWEAARAEVGAAAWPGGESFSAFGQRVTAALSRLAAAHPGQRVAVFAHGGVIEVSFLAWMGIPLARAAEVFVHVDHAALFRWRVPAGPGPVELLAANETRHLG